jgi:type IV secretion system protein VirB2
MPQLPRLPELPQLPHSLFKSARTALVGAAEFVTFTVMYAVPVHAAGSGLPWEAPLQQILESIEGPVAKIIAVIAIITTGLSLAFGDTSGGFRRLVQIVFGLSIAFAATSFFLSFFSFGGGAVIA